jgi:hypothetical protein
VGCLFGGPAITIQGEAHHEGLDAPLVDQGFQALEIRRKFAPGQGHKRGHGDPKGVAARQAYALATHIQGQG